MGFEPYGANRIYPPVKLAIIGTLVKNFTRAKAMIAPFVAELAQKYDGRLRVGSLDAGAQPDIQYSYGVMGLPTLILFHHGEPVKRIVGFQPRERLDSQIAPFLPVENPT